MDPAELTEAEGELFLPFATDTLQRMVEVRGPEAPPVRVVLDVGSGPGVGTCELARRFPGASIVAIDASPDMLARAEARARRAGLDAVVTTHLAELPDGLDALPVADVVWMSMTLHHIGDELAALRALRRLLEPGHGMIGIAERAAPLQFLPDDATLCEPGLPARVDEAFTRWFAERRAVRVGPTMASAEVEDTVGAAGFNVIGAFPARRRFTSPLSDVARKVALGNVGRARQNLTDHLNQTDLAALSALADPDEPRSLHHRDDVTLVASRHIVVAAG